MVIKKSLLMDAGVVLFQSSGGFGPNLGQLKTELASMGRVITLSDIPEDVIPAPMRGFDFLLDQSNFLQTNYLAVKFSDAGTAGSNDADGREIRRYAVELLATPHRKTNKSIALLRAKYSSK